MVLHVVLAEKLLSLKEFCVKSLFCLSLPSPPGTLCLDGEDRGEAVSEKSPDFCVLPFLLYFWVIECDTWKIIQCFISTVFKQVVLCFV